MIKNRKNAASDHTHKKKIVKKKFLKEKHD
jgi:hypothetical protein